MNSFDLALNYLTYKSRTEKEIRDYLKKKKIAPKYIDETVKKLKKYNYLNDQQYVKQYYEINKVGKRYGRKRLLRDLRRKGINETDLMLLEEMLTDDEEESNCLFHFKKILKMTEKLPYKKKVQRITSGLNSKGFSYQTYSDYISDIPKNEEIDQQAFNETLIKTIERFKNKGYIGSELKNRIIRSLIGKGYSYSLIKDNLDEYLDE